ncbi:MAG: WG repeat-containing protein [Myxococcota bacterium]|jgi:hypothetical protein|nr:WG repeat-containing protein [Myxococcota bacterium]
MSIRCRVAFVLVLLAASCTTLSSSIPSPRYQVCVVDAEKRCGVIDDYGELKIPLESSALRSIGSFRDGRAVLINQEKLEGWIDADGNIEIEPSFVGLWLPSEGLVCFWTEAGCGFMDSEGGELISVQWDGCSGFQEGRATVRKNVGEQRRLGFIDRSGKAITELSFDVAEKS